MCNQTQGTSSHYNVFSGACPSRKLLNDVTRRWSFLVLATLLDAPARFSTLREHVGGISDRMLSSTLTLLLDDGLIVKNASHESIEYQLTVPGKTIAQQSLQLFNALYHSLDQLFPPQTDTCSDSEQ
ncbi:winged helix-turn-helix transcriptional regulator [Bifidobacterium aquikefiri]